MTPEEVNRILNNKLVRFAESTTRDVISAVQRQEMCPLLSDVTRAQLQVIIGFAVREAAIAGMQAQARKQGADARRMLLSDKPMAGVVATARRVVSDLRPAEHIPQRLPQVVTDAKKPIPPAETDQRWDDATTEPMYPPRPRP